MAATTCGLLGCAVILLVVEPHHVEAAAGIVELVPPLIERHRGKYTITISGESGSGSSETATGLAEALKTPASPASS